jgi:hypothetical protein
MSGQPMHTVYVASRADGFHKIGVTYDAEQRLRVLSRNTKAELRPIWLVRAYDLGRSAPTVEKAAHAEMLASGHEMLPLEWFDASASECVAAVERAIRLIDQIGTEGWKRQRVRAYHRSRKLKTWAAVAEKLPAGMTTKDLWQKYGPRNSEEQ